MTLVVVATREVVTAGAVVAAPAVVEAAVHAGVGEGLIGEAVGVLEACTRGEAVADNVTVREETGAEQRPATAVEAAATTAALPRSVRAPCSSQEVEERAPPARTTA